MPSIDCFLLAFISSSYSFENSGISNQGFGVKLSEAEFIINLL
jgi:hypothetical protein